MLLLLLLLASSTAHAERDDSFLNAYTPTKGELLPRADIRKVQESFRIITASSFEFRIIGKTCDIVKNATARYKNFMLNDEIRGWGAWTPEFDAYSRVSINRKADLNYLDIDLINPCERLPYFQMNENYSLTISESTAVLRAPQVWGILRGLESFYQLPILVAQGFLIMKCQEIADSPRFPYRGLLLDTGSVYLPVSDILMTLDAMSYEKFNVFHWHIVDDESFPYVSTYHPELSERGAFNSTMIYTKKDVKKIVEYARLRGIRVIPEFNTPGHTASWGRSHPEILTQCYNSGKPNGKLGPMNPLKSETRSLLRTLYAEIFFSFPDRYVHVGGDKFSYKCWNSNPEIQRRIEDLTYGLDMIEGEFYFNLLPILTEANRSLIAWAGTYSTLVGLPTDTILQVAKRPWRKIVKEHVKDNQKVVLSSCWNLTVLELENNWQKFYSCNPTDFEGTEKMKDLVMGGEITMWGEQHEGRKIHERIWPRASAVAERLWSREKEEQNKFSKRLDEHICRLKRRGVPAALPIGLRSCHY